MIMNESRKNVPIFVLVGVTYAVNQSLCRQRRRNVGVEKVECWWGGDSRVMRFPPKAAIRRLRRVCVTLNVAGVAVDVLESGCVFFSVWTSKESHLI